MKKILVAVDGSDCSKKGLEMARKIGLEDKCDIMLLNVVNDIMNTPYVSIREYKVAINKALLEEGNRILAEATEYFNDYPGEVKTAIKYGDPAQKIIDAAETNEYDLVIMGSRGLNAISRAMLGSVSNKVLNHIKVSVLIVK